MIARSRIECSYDFTRKICFHTSPRRVQSSSMSNHADVCSMNSSSTAASIATDPPVRVVCRGRAAQAGCQCDPSRYISTRTVRTVVLVAHRGALRASRGTYADLRM